MGDLPQYVVGTVPDTLFTRNELNQLGKVPIDPNQVAGFVVYPVQNREYKLYHIDNTREPVKQETDGIRLSAIKSRTINEILERRKEYAVHGTRGIGVKKP